MTLQYSLHALGSMLRDRHRVDAYIEAMQAAIHPGDLVLEIGTGIGFFAVAAARLGARHVIAVEPDDTIYLARSIVEANGLEDQITLIQGRSDELDLKEPVDVVISDLRGATPFYERSIASIIDVRRRLVAPGARLIPERDDLYACLVDDATLFAGWAVPWSSPLHGVDLGAARPFAVNAWAVAHLGPHQMAIEPELWGSVDYRTAESTDARGVVSWQTVTPITAHGVACWFDSSLGGGATLSNDPRRASTVYGQAFFPFEDEVRLQDGDHIQIELEAIEVAGTYHWRWLTTVTTKTNRVQMSQSSNRAVIAPAPSARRPPAQPSTALNEPGHR